MMTDKKEAISLGENIEVGTELNITLQSVEDVVPGGVVVGFAVYTDEENVFSANDLTSYTITADDAEKKIEAVVSVLLDGHDEPVQVSFEGTVGAAPEVDEEALVDEPVAAVEESAVQDVGRGQHEPAVEIVPASVPELLDRFESSNTSTLSVLAKVLRSYREKMGRGTGFSFEIMHEQQCQLWSAVRAALANGATFREAMFLINEVIAENHNGAFAPVAMQRTIHTVASRLPDSHRQAFVNLFTVLQFAANTRQLNTVKKNFDLQKAISEQVFDPQTRMRLIGYFD